MSYKMRDPGRGKGTKGFEEGQHPRDDHGRFSSGEDRAATKEHFDKHISPTGKLTKQILPEGSHHWDQGMPSEKAIRDSVALHDHLAAHIARDPKWRAVLEAGDAPVTSYSAKDRPPGWKHVLGSAQNLQSLAALGKGTRITGGDGIANTLYNQARVIAGLPTRRGN